MSVNRAEVPAWALLARYSEDDGAYVDAFAAIVATPISLPSYVETFFQTAIFRVERRILALGGAATDDAQIKALAHGDGTEMAAWRVEDRSETQLLLTVPNWRIRTWLAVEGSKIWFGSAVLPGSNGKIAAPVKLTMPGHRIYSRVLLTAAHRALEQG